MKSLLDQHPLSEILFDHGELFVRKNLTYIVSSKELNDAIERHERGDWGLVGPIGQKLNDQALMSGEKLVSLYETEDRELYLVVTRGDRRTTWVALKDDPVWDEMFGENQLSEAIH